MIASCLIGVLCGLLLGIRFKVFVIFPVQIMGMMLLGSFVGLDRMTATHAIVLFVCWCCSLQLTYIVTLMTTSASARRMLRPSVGRA